MNLFKQKSYLHFGRLVDILLSCLTTNSVKLIHWHDLSGLFKTNNFATHQQTVRNFLLLNNSTMGHNLYHCNISAFQCAKTADLTYSTDIYSYCLWMGNPCIFMYKLYIAEIYRHGAICLLLTVCIYLRSHLNSMHALEKAMYSVKQWANGTLLPVNVIQSHLNWSVSNSSPVHVLEPLFWTGELLDNFWLKDWAIFHGSIFNVDPWAPRLQLMLFGCTRAICELKGTGYL